MIKKVKILVASVLTSLLIVPQTAMASALDNIQRYYYNGHLYAVVDDPTAEGGMSNLQRVAEGLGGHLAYIESSSENDFVGSLIDTYGTHPYYAIGMYKSGGVWKYYDGRNVVYTHWGAGEPNNNWNGYEENHGEIFRGTAGAYWNDIPNVIRGNTAGGVFEWDELRYVFSLGNGFDTVRQGDTIEVDMTFSNNEDMKSILFNLNYNSDMLKLEKVEAEEDLKVIKTAKTKGNVNMGMKSNNNLPIESGHVAKFTFRTLKKGKTNCILTKARGSKDRIIKSYSRYDCVGKIININ